jgi:hypothetical protein
MSLTAGGFYGGWLYGYWLLWKNIRYWFLYILMVRTQSLFVKGVGTIFLNLFSIVTVEAKASVSH